MTQHKQDNNKTYTFLFIKYLFIDSEGCNVYLIAMLFYLAHCDLLLLLSVQSNKSKKKTNNVYCFLFCVVYTNVGGAKNGDKGSEGVLDKNRTKRRLELKAEYDKQWQSVELQTLELQFMASAYNFYAR